MTRWTAIEDQCMREFYPRLSASDMAAMLKRSKGAVHARARQLGVSKAPTFASESSRRTTLARSRFTPEVAATIERLYPTTLTEEIAAMLGLETARVLAYANGRGWKKTPEFVRATARARTGPDHPMRQYQFQKGAVPMNKGVKGWESGGRSVETRFKKGEMHGAAQHNYKPIGSLRICADGYLERKVTDDHPVPVRRWVAVHRLVWEAANGPIPAGHIVRFRDGMATTEPDLITLDRLECITRVENMRRNSVHTVYPPELARLALLRGALNRQINARQRAAEDA